MKKGHHSLLICLQVERKEKYSCGGTNCKIAHVNQSNHIKLQFTVGNTHINASASFGLVYWSQGPITLYRRGLAKKIGPTL